MKERKNDTISVMIVQICYDWLLRERLEDRCICVGNVPVNHKLSVETIKYKSRA